METSVTQTHKDTQISLGVVTSWGCDVTNPSTAELCSEINSDPVKSYVTVQHWIASTKFMFQIHVNMKNSNGNVSELPAQQLQRTTW